MIHSVVLLSTWLIESAASGGDAISGTASRAWAPPGGRMRRSQAGVWTVSFMRCGLRGPGLNGGVRGRPARRGAGPGLLSGGEGAGCQRLRRRSAGRAGRPGIAVPGRGTPAQQKSGFRPLFSRGPPKLVREESVSDGVGDGFLGPFPPVAEGVMADSGLGGDLRQREAFEPVP